MNHNLFSQIILTAAIIFSLWVLAEVVKHEFSPEQMHHELIMKCLGKDTAANCVAIFKQGNK